MSRADGACCRARRQVTVTHVGRPTTLIEVGPGFLAQSSAELAARFRWLPIGVPASVDDLA